MIPIPTRVLHRVHSHCFCSLEVLVVCRGELHTVGTLLQLRSKWHYVYILRFQRLNSHRPLAQNRTSIPIERKTAQMLVGMELVAVVVAGLVVVAPVELEALLLVQMYCSPRIAAVH